MSDQLGNNLYRRIGQRQSHTQDTDGRCQNSKFVVGILYPVSL